MINKAAHATIDRPYYSASSVAGRDDACCELLIRCRTESGSMLIHLGTLISARGGAGLASSPGLELRPRGRVLNIRWRIALHDSNSA